MNFLKRSSGASYIESAIAIPIAIIVMFGFTYFSMALIALGILDHAANRTMRAISTHPAFDKPPDTACEDFEGTYDCNSTDDSDDFCKNLYCLKEQAKKIPLGTFFGMGIASGKIVYIDDAPNNPDVIMPTVEVNQSYEDALKKQPVVVTLTAKLRNPFPWFGDISITSTATGFIEIRTKPNLPSLMDCNGYRKGDPRYKTEPCQCDASKNQVWNQSFNSGEGGCETCPYDRKAPNADGSIPDGWYQTTLYACLCPKSSKCKELYPGSYTIWGGGGFNANRDCRCACSQNEGWNTYGNGNLLHDVDIPPGGCQCLPAINLSSDGTFGQYPSDSHLATYNQQYVDASVDPQSVVVKFKPQRVIHTHATAADKCLCQKLDGSYLSSAECDAIWGPVIGYGEVEVYRQNYCQCFCKDHCSAQGATLNTSWFPQNGCHCTCPGLKKYNQTTRLCGCEDVSGNLMPDCPAPSTYNSNCQCECPNNICGENIIKDPNTGCTCNGCTYGVVNNPASSRHGLCKLNDSDVGG